MPKQMKRTGYSFGTLIRRLEGLCTELDEMMRDGRVQDGTQFKVDLSTALQSAYAERSKYRRS